MLDPTIIVAIINLASLIFTTVTKVASDHLGKCKNEDNSEETALSAHCVTAVSSPKVQELNGTIQLLERRMDGKKMEVKSLQKRIKTIRAEGLELDRWADEAIGTYGTSVHGTMLFHGLGSIFLQLNYPYFGTSVSVLMVVSFFFTFAVAWIVSFNKIEKMSQREKDLQRRLGELQRDIAYFQGEIESEIERTFSDPIGALGDRIRSLDRDAGALQSEMTGLREISSNSESNRSNSLSKIAALAIIYGLCFPTMAHYLFFVNFGRRRFAY